VQKGLTRVKYLKLFYGKELSLLKASFLIAERGVIADVMFRRTLGKYRAYVKVAVTHNIKMLADCSCCVGP